MIRTWRDKKGWKSTAGTLPAAVKGALTTLGTWAANQKHELTEVIMEAKMSQELPIPEFIASRIEEIRQQWEALSEAERIAIGHVRINVIPCGVVVVDRLEDTRGKAPAGLRM
jgi:hypothetical protein